MMSGITYNRKRRKQGRWEEREKQRRKEGREEEKRRCKKEKKGRTNGLSK